ncbi:unnamed protein product [Rhodiola kirilowii]
MKEEETIAEFNARVLDLSNEAAALGKPIKAKKMTCKVLRSLPQMFAMKVTSIEEMHDISTLKLEELMGSLRTYEMNQLQAAQPRGGKGIALKAEVCLLYRTNCNDGSRLRQNDEENQQIWTRSRTIFLKQLPELEER